MSREIIFRAELYLLSLWLLFALLFLMTVDAPICFDANCVFIGASELLKRNYAALVSLAFLVAGAISYARFRYMVSASTDLPRKVEECENADYDQLTFLTTYIVPFVGLDITRPRYAITLGVLLAAIGVIFVRTEKYYQNPTLALLGFRLIHATVNDRKNGTSRFTVLCKDQIERGDMVHTLKLGPHVLYARKATRGD